MTLLITLVATPIVAYLLRTPLQRIPIAFYLLSLLVCVFGMYLVFAPPQYALARSVAAYLQQGNLPFALFALVMFAGVFKDGSKLKHAFMPIRAELAIVASILICVHIIPYMVNYLSSFSELAYIKTHVLISLGISVLLVLLLVPLFVTSLPAIRKRMNVDVWRRVQWLAYPFFILIFIHISGYFLPLVLKGHILESLNLGIYMMLFAAYLAMKAHKSIQKIRKAEVVH